MVNRPRRPRTGGRPETTIDLEAERLAGGSATAAPAERDMQGDASRDLGPLAGGAAEPAPTAADGDATTTGLDDGGRNAVADAEPAEADRLATGSGSAIAAGDAGAAELSGTATGGDRLPDLASDETATSPLSTEADLSRDEGLTADERRRRDLGEFEDDDTVPAATLPDASSDAADPLATSPYHPAAVDEARSGPGFGSLAGAGLLGAVLALGAGAGLLYSGVLPPPGRDAAPAATQQFATAGEVQQIGGDVSSLREVVEQLQSAQAAGGVGPGTVSLADFTALTDRVAANERGIQSGGTSSGDAAAAAQAASAAAAEAQTTATAATDAANTARETADAARTTADGATATANEARTAAGEARSTADTARQTAEDARNASQSASQVAQNAQGAAAEAEQAVGDFAGRLDAIETANRQASVALSAAALKAAIDRGTPFMAELERFTQASESPDTTERLRDFAATGVPSTATLAGRWPATETAILDALRPAPAPDAPVGEQVLSGLRSLVTVRPAAEPAGSGEAEGANEPSAAVARMDGAIGRGDLAAWLDAWNSLPQAAQSASSTFADEVRARIAADGVIDQSINGAIGATASQG